MNIIVIALFLGSGCFPMLSEQKSDNKSIHMLVESNFLHDALDARLIISTTKEHRSKDLKSLVALIKSPSSEILSELPEEREVPLRIKMLEKGHLFSLMRLKKYNLEPGFYYGLYTRLAKNWELTHVFYVSHAPPKLLSHNLGDHDGTKIIAKNRRHFSFYFDQPVTIPSDKAISLVGKMIKAPNLSSIKITPDRKTLKIFLDDGIKFEEGQTYSFIFENLENLEGQSVRIEPIEFVVGCDAGFLKELQQIAFDISSNSVEISWYLNNAHEAELFILEDFPSNPGNFASPLRFASAVPSDILLEDSGFLSSILISDLKSERSYSYILRAEDHQGDILIARGTFKTRNNVGLHFSEILINPKTSSEHNAEFIEFFYDGKPHQFNNLKLVLESPGGNKHTCIIASFENPLMLKSGDYFIVVGREFDALKAQVPKDAIIVRLANKQLCGGLSNTKKSIIKLMDESGLIDRFGAHLWQAPEGVSVRRRSLGGLDEFDNYCYSETSRGPTPGGPH